MRQRHPGRFRCCGVLIDSLTPEAATQALLTSRHGQARRAHLCDTYTVSIALADTEFRDLLNASDINFPASTRLVRQGRRLAARNLTDRIHPPTLMFDTMSQGRQPGLRHYLCGPTPEVVKTLKKTLLEKLPGVDIVATSVLAFPIMPAENAALRKLAADYRPDIVWVGCETPQQHGFVAEYASVLGTTLVAVGDAFSVLSGVKPPSRPWTTQLLGTARFGYGTLTDKRRSRKLDRVP
ncbi:glycosyl transferase WecB/TagA/CpsF [Stackebrandtia nassauensis DSM 44728]|uniref:Glycosyl transferase WecB/TagA/CpsF n=1 Tax=Stackebrandtia nassauensis (strain DSM 44728 / CIP 108903 / NRRL B-16338 / NBRC 102104 / LLR-40K-21) TaxID=446470 RepID=D3Q308_STANL|nr:glycosyl transferase WecB/TagA/CpsF [Stackebrandtia nassauensis DSM 44728]